MKIRNGFVSNSSSSSFVIYGIGLDIGDALTKLGIDREDYEDDSGIIEEHLDGFLNKYNLEVYNSYEDETVFIGKPPESFEDNRLVGDIKKEVELVLKNQFGNNVNASWHSETIYN